MDDAAAVTTAAAESLRRMPYWCLLLLNRAARLMSAATMETRALDVRSASKILSRRRLLAGVLAIAATGAAACGRRGNDSRTRISIGVILPLSGSAAALGTDCRNGVRLAADEYNAARRPGEPRIAL